MPGSISNHLFWNGMLSTLGPQLEALDLSACGRYINENVLQQIEEYCPGLMALNLSANYCVKDNILKHLLPKLQRLCHLHLCACNLLTDKALEYIGEYAPPDLQFLGLCMRGGGPNQFTEQNLYRMVTKCERLKSISLGPVDQSIKDRIDQYLKSRSDQYLNRGEEYSEVVVEGNTYHSISNNEGQHSLKNKNSSDSNRSNLSKTSNTSSSSSSTNGSKKHKTPHLESLHPFHCFCKESFLFHNHY